MEPASGEIPRSELRREGSTWQGGKHAPSPQWRGEQYSADPAWHAWPWNVLSQDFLLIQQWGHHANCGMRGVAPYVDPDSWERAAEEHEESWWPAWEAWLARPAGPLVAPPPVVEGAPAPDRYVLDP